MKQQVSLLVIAMFVSMGVNAQVTTFCDGTTVKPCLVQDIQDTNTGIRHFRTARMIADAYKGDITGLANLKISGSGAPNALGWHKIVELISTNNEKIKLLDIDLRQESHGYLNNISINLSSTYNWINLNKTLEEIHSAENDWLQSITKNATVDNVLSVAQFEAHDFDHGITLPVKTVTTEKTLVESYGYSYLRLPVTDHRTPLNNEVDSFVLLVRNLPANTWVHLHCRGGKGRTTTFMAMYDMLKNADNVSFDEIIKRQAAIDPFYDLSDLQRSDPQLAIYYKERYVFLENFYKYAYSALHGYQGTWSEWLQAGMFTA